MFGIGSFVFFAFYSNYNFMRATDCDIICHLFGVQV